MKALLAFILIAMFIVQPVLPKLTYAIPPLPPLNTPFAGVVVLNVTIDSTGNVRNISTVAGASPFLKASFDAVKQWKFTTARDLNGERLVSVIFLYRPRQIFSSGSGMQLPERHSAAQPALPTLISDASYPVNAVAEGVVILELKVSADGAIEQIKTIRDVPSLTDVDRKAVETWTFSPAVAAGRAVEGTSIAAISFLRPIIQ